MNKKKDIQNNAPAPIELLFDERIGQAERFIGEQFVELSKAIREGLLRHDGRIANIEASLSGNTQVIDARMAHLKDSTDQWTRHIEKLLAAEHRHLSVLIDEADKRHTLHLERIIQALNDQSQRIDALAEQIEQIKPLVKLTGILKGFLKKKASVS